jgi:hypothetical protein
MMGPWIVPVTGHPLCIALSLALFAVGGAIPIDGFCLRTMSDSRHTTIMGPILDMVVVSYIVGGTSCEELGI